MTRILLAATLLPLAVSAQRNLPPDADRQLAREIFKEFVEIKSGYSTGSTTPVADAAARRLRAAGFPAADIFVGGPAPHKHNLVLLYRASDAHKPLILLSHNDFVETKREDWSI